MKVYYLYIYGSKNQKSLYYNFYLIRIRFSWIYQIRNLQIHWVQTLLIQITGYYLFIYGSKDQQFPIYFFN